MASLIKEKNKNGISWRICYTAADGSRPSIRLGMITKADAETVTGHVERIIAAKKHGIAVDPKTQGWIDQLNDDYAGKLAALDLVPKRGTATIQGFITEYIATRTDAQANTRRNWKNTLAAMTKYFGENRGMRTITASDADDWRQAMVNKGVAEATISKWIVHAKFFYKKAMRKKLVSSNPFTDVVAGSQANPARLRFIDRATIETVLESCPSQEWKAIIALSRFGGLRCPSETLALKWTDVNWADGRILVTSSKGKRHGKGERVVPLFPELEKILREAFEAAPDGTVFVVPSYQSEGDKNLRTQFLRILRKAGVASWPRLFHNLRASRETELADKFPLQAVTAWMGNTPAVAAKHYLQVTENHFAMALTTETGSEKTSVQKAAYPEIERDRTRCTNQIGADQISPHSSSLSNSYHLCTTVQIPPIGVEPNSVTSNSSNELRQIANQIGVKSGVFDSENVKTDPQLSRLIECWPSLPAAVRADLVALAVAESEPDPVAMPRG
jgi:integrase